MGYGSERLGCIPLRGTAVKFDELSFGIQPGAIGRLALLITVLCLLCVALALAKLSWGHQG